MIWRAFLAGTPQGRGLHWLCSNRPGPRFIIFYKAWKYRPFYDISFSSNFCHFNTLIFVKPYTAKCGLHNIIVVLGRTCLTTYILFGLRAHLRTVLAVAYLIGLGSVLYRNSCRPTFGLGGMPNCLLHM